LVSGTKEVKPVKCELIFRDSTFDKYIMKIYNFLLLFFISIELLFKAAAILQWNPSQLHIKTRTVEKTLEPLVLQVTTLVSSSANGEL